MCVRACGLFGYLASPCSVMFPRCLPLYPVNEASAYLRNIVKLLPAYTSHSGRPNKPFEFCLHTACRKFSPIPARLFNMQEVLCSSLGRGTDFMTEVHRGSPQSAQANTGIVRRCLVVLAYYNNTQHSRGETFCSSGCSYGRRPGLYEHSLWVHRHEGVSRDVHTKNMNTRTATAQRGRPSTSF